MNNLIEERVKLANEEKNPFVICRLKSGWVVIGDVQPLEGYCLLLADPVVADINSLDEEERKQYLYDTTLVGDALLKVTESYRVNYETWGNSEPALHTHIMPRYLEEDEEVRRKPACMSYSWGNARRYDLDQDKEFIQDMRKVLKPHSI